MNEQSKPQGPGDSGGEATALRSVLELMRKQAEQEISRLNRRLAEREYAIEHKVSSATERQAMQQELATLQHALGLKEQNLDRLTEECRRLEDQLEDQYAAFDGLKQEVQRKDLSLKAAREEVQRLKYRLAEIKEPSSEIDRTVRPGHSTSVLAPSVEPASLPSRFLNVSPLSAGALSGFAVLGLVALFLWGGRDIELPNLTDALPEPPTVRATPPVAVGTPEPEPAADRAPVETAPAAPLTAATAPLQPPSVQRDRLRNGSLGPALARLEGGTFRMGHNSLGGADTGPEHEVQVGPFSISAYEVTFAQYDSFVRATGRRFPDDFGWGRGDRPVVGVSWSDADAYADWLTRQTGKRYRLPSEAEWEYAARAGGQGSYWWGFGMEPGRAVCFDCGTEWDNRSTAPVGSFAASTFGLYDIAGNAQEWVADCYSPGYEGAPTDGRPRIDGDCTYRVARGGAYNKPAASMRTYVRAKLVPESRLNMLGFRVARDP